MSEVPWACLISFLVLDPRKDNNTFPLLFALFLNDIKYFISGKCNDLSVISDLVHDIFDSNEIIASVTLYTIL